VAKRLEQVAPQAAEVAALPAPVAPMQKRNNPPRAAEASSPARGACLPSQLGKHPVNQPDVNSHANLFVHCRRTLGSRTWGRVMAAMAEEKGPSDVPEALEALSAAGQAPGYLADLARLEWALHQAAHYPAPLPAAVAQLTINPTLSLIPVSFKHLPALLASPCPSEPATPEPGESRVLVWRPSRDGDPVAETAEDIDLLALKIAAENIDPREAAAAGNVSVGAIRSALDRAVAKGLLFVPEGRIRRRLPADLETATAAETFIAPDTFTLQWHITQRCDLHCRHCYDRSDRTPMAFDTAISILNDFYDFCRSLHVRGQVSFTGGNPMLYPRFGDLYRAAWERGFGTAILGNPTPAEHIEALCEIARPLFFQVSLEGLQAHNDYIRGDGHFERTFRFLDVLRRFDIYAMVMLTLTRDNMDQVLPLAELLRERADFFTFNRLAAVGEGARLAMVPEAEFEAFLERYDRAAQTNPVMGLKDNLFNIVRHRNGADLFGGCTGYGCGAAFNFVALLADGEVHACRKFPSLIGNIHQDRLIDIYQSALSRRYRAGSTACSGCNLYAVCRGCPAVTYSSGKDVFAEKDPFCFYLGFYHQSGNFSASKG
jgi:selenobiotic family peptide radical SAM maturase